MVEENAPRLRVAFLELVMPWESFIFPPHDNMRSLLGLLWFDTSLCQRSWQLLFSSEASRSERWLERTGAVGLTPTRQSSVSNTVLLARGEIFNFQYLDET